MAVARSLGREVLPVGVKLASYHLSDGIAQLTISGFASVSCGWTGRFQRPTMWSTAPKQHALLAERKR
jgi:hypothetical protein